MNYISEIRAFYDIAESLDLSSSCICLWHALMYQANKLGWLDEFSLPISTLELRTKLGKSAIYTARNTLKQYGLISVKEREGRQSAMYSMHSLCPFNGHKTGGNPEHNTAATPNTTQSQHERNPELLTKLNETIFIVGEQSPPTIKSKKFIPPTIDEVRAYCQERNNGIDPKAFVDFYESKGWMVGKNKMSSWKHAVGTWEAKKREEHPPQRRYKELV